ncbi:hypothetical protein PH7735_02790 [Shimia thalassica]|uniref:DUF304 domain-containing protein n=1 Tax=Shimia thalassica TaxID=1715693 RepID=A0A0P1IC19_9RHOB|nr:hypothetical protein [Shimia thalassica]CUK04506.1 hypothetical protein PH7735_02790 [Shimia thalassica]
MNAQVGTNIMGVAGYQTLSATQGKAGFTVREVNGHFRHTSRNEAVVRFLGIVIILGAFIQHLVPDTLFGGNPAMTKVLLSVAFSCVGIALYSFAVRGHRSEIVFDPLRQDICISKLDRRGNLRLTKHIPLSQIKSIYVLKAETPGVPSKLRVKMMGDQPEISALRGPYEEIELMHRQLCRVIRIAQS